MSRALAVASVAAAVGLAVAGYDLVCGLTAIGAAVVLAVLDLADAVRSR